MSKVFVEVVSQVPLEDQELAAYYFSVLARAVVAFIHQNCECDVAGNSTIISLHSPPEVSLKIFFKSNKRIPLEPVAYGVRSLLYRSLRNGNEVTNYISTVKVYP